MKVTQVQTSQRYREGKVSTTAVAYLTGDEQRVDAAGLTPWRWNQRFLSALFAFIILSVSMEIPGGQLDTEGVSYLQDLRWTWTGKDKRQFQRQVTSNTMNELTVDTSTGRCRAHLPFPLLLHTSRVSITIFPSSLRDTFYRYSERCLIYFTLCFCFKFYS